MISNPSLPSFPPSFFFFFTGIYNFTNPGAITHNQILALYKKHVDPSYTWENFTVRFPLLPSSISLGTLSYVVREQYLVFLRAAIHISTRVIVAFLLACPPSFP